MRYRLRTLLILLAVGPPLLAGAWLGEEWITSGPVFDSLSSAQPIGLACLAVTVACGFLAVILAIRGLSSG